uniref:CSON011711 protein n=1 Tax=Culicoides sonorensis TaxID=179676 RepID=A0A336M3S3_CULSO
MNSNNNTSHHHHHHHHSGIDVADNLRYLEPRLLLGSDFHLAPSPLPQTRNEQQQLHHHHHHFPHQQKYQYLGDVGGRNLKPSIRNAMSRQSLIDLVNSPSSSRPNLGPSFSQQAFFSESRDSLSLAGGCGSSSQRPSILNPHVSAAKSEMDLTNRKNRKKERGRLKASGEQPLLGSWSQSGATRESNANTIDTATSTHHLTAPTTSGNNNSNNNGNSSTNNDCNGAERLRRSGCSSTSTSKKSSGTKWTFVFDPAGRLCYYWSMVVSLAFLYNFWVIIYRFAFQEINGETIVVWFCLDYFSDFLYLVDILFHFRTGYLEDGVLQTDSTKLRQHYMNSTTFYIDCLCLLPLDFLYLSIGFNSILRSFRLVKIYRFWAFMDRTERHTNYPNLFRSTSLIHYLLVIFHWNGCLYHIIYKNNGFGSKNWVYHDSESADVVKQYLQSYYWCTLALTTIGDLPRPRSKAEYVFVIGQLLFGLMLFATVLGHVANIVTSVSAARKEFQDLNISRKPQGKE